MRILEFRTVRAVDHVGHRFRLSQVHLAVQEGAARKLTRFRKAHTFDTADSLQQVAHDKRVPVRVEFQHIFAGVRIRAFEKQVQQAINHLACLRVARSPETCLARLKRRSMLVAEQAPNHVTDAGAAHAERGNGTDARRRHRRNNRLGIHALKIVNRNPRLVGFSFVTSLLVYVQGLRV